MKKRISLFLALVLAVCLLSACTDTNPSDSAAGGSLGQPDETSLTLPDADSSVAVRPQALIMGTGSSGGTYFSLGGAMASAINGKLADRRISITAQASGASVENCNLIQSGEMALGIAMNNVAADAVAGTGVFSAPCDKVMAIGVVYNEVYQIVANANTNAKNVEDLKGLRVAVGPAGSGSVGLSEKVFAAVGIDIRTDLKSQSDGFGDAATKMQDGHLDAACGVLGVPASSIVEMTATMDLAYVNISDDILMKIREDAPYFTRYIIPAGTYAGQTEDVATITCKAVLYCSSDLDEETVYLITKAFYESADEIAAAHATGKEIKLEGCLDGVTTPIHPGAVRYYQENGIPVPSN